jgi:hypothetical protein
MSSPAKTPRKRGKKKSNTVNVGFAFIMAIFTNQEIWKFLGHLLTVIFHR